MADTTVAGDVSSQCSLKNGPWGPYWTDESIAIVVYPDGGTDANFARTTNKGASWAITEIEEGSTKSIAAWYDKETPGDSGTLVHIAWLDSSGDDQASYVTVDVSDGSVGTVRAVATGITISATSHLNRISITKTVNGNIIVAFKTPAEIACYKSSDNFATAGTKIADVFESSTEDDWVHLYPANVDAGDACALFWDTEPFGNVNIKMYDDSADSWTETQVSALMTPSEHFHMMDGAIRHSDNHLLASGHSFRDTTTNDLHSWDITVDSIASPTVTDKADVVTDQPESGHVSVFIDQQANDVYVTYEKGGSYLSTVDCVYHKSTDGMATWGAEQAYSENAADDFRNCQAGRSVGATGGRFMPVFYNDDLTDLFVNETNAVEIAAGGGGPSLISSRRLLSGTGR